MKITPQLLDLRTYRGRPDARPYTGRTVGAPVALRDLPRERQDQLLARFLAPGENAPRQGSALIPRPEEIVTVTVRAISADHVPGHEIDHSDEAHLRAAVPLFGGAPDAKLPVHEMHFGFPSALVGYADTPRWDPAPMGRNRRPGINVEVAILGGLSPQAKVIAVGVVTQALTRWSSCFQLEAEPSHPDMDCEQFWRLLGTEADGQRVRWIAKEITDAYELSVVDVGAIESARTADLPAMRAQRTTTDTKPRLPRAAAPIRRGA